MSSVSLKIIIFRYDVTLVSDILLKKLAWRLPQTPGELYVRLSCWKSSQQTKAWTFKLATLWFFYFTSSLIKSSFRDGDCHLPAMFFVVRQNEKKKKNENI